MGYIDLWSDVQSSSLFDEVVCHLHIHTFHNEIGEQMLYYFSKTYLKRRLPGFILLSSILHLADYVVESKN